MEVSLRDLGLKRWMSRGGMYDRLLKAIPKYEWRIWRVGEDSEVVGLEEMVRLIGGSRRGWVVLEGAERLVIKVSGFKYYEGREKAG